MGDFYKKLTIFGKIFGLSLVVLFFSGVTILFLYITIGAYNKRDDARLLTISMLQARRSEKDFLLGKKLNDAEKVKAAVENFNKILKPYVDDDNGKNLLNLSNDYYSRFQSVVSSKVEQGLDENSGKMGELRNEIHSLEKSVQEKNHQELLIPMLSARRSEKDFLLRGDESYVQKVESAVSLLKKNIASSKLSEADKSELISLAGSYFNGFRSLASLMSDEKQKTEEFRETVHKAEPLMEAMVQDMESKASFYTWFSILVMVLSAGATVYVSNKVSKNIAKAVVDLATVSDAVASGDLSVHSDYNSNDELGTLSKSINTMISNLEKSRVELVNEKLKVEKNAKEIEEQKKYLVENVEEILEGMNKFADGDLCVHMEIKNDDAIGKLSNGFNKAVSSFRNIILSVSEAVQATASASSEISSSSEQMAAGSQEQSSQTTEVAGAVEEMTKTIFETTKNSSLAAESAKKAGTIANEGGKVVAETIDGMNMVAEVVKKSAETVHALGKSSDQIGEIVQVIDDIADQTNLLALNAAIEAARAGEQGRGFAVVADEVRKLAERTTKATKEIASMIRQIQKDTEGAVASMNKGTAEVEKGKSLADRAGQSLKEIIKGSEEVVDIITQVAAASEEQSSAAEQISKNVEAISNVTHESSAGIQQIARASEDLNRLTVNLQEMILQFKIDDNSTITVKNSNNKKAPYKSQVSVRTSGGVLAKA